MAVLWILAAWTVFVYIAEILVFRNTYNFIENLSIHANKRFRKYSPFVSVIVPCKGLDYGLEENIKAILSQDYKKRETIFVLDDFRDPAYNILKRFRGPVRIIRARKIKTCSGKVAAQITALDYAKGEVYLFADSDIRPAKNWLSEMVRPLADKAVGGTTAYRWYFPTANNFLSYLKSAWNTIGIGIMFGKHAFIWGGSFALKRETFKRLGICEQWVNAISDDTVVTRSLRKANLKIFFVPKAISASFDKTTWLNLKEWTNRQIFFVRNYDYRAWRAAFIIYGFFNLTLLTGIVSLALGILDSRFFLLGILLLLPQLFTLARNYFRNNSIARLLPEYKKYFEQNKGKLLLADLLVKPLVMYNVFKTRRMKKVSWRGKEYTIK